MRRAIWLLGALSGALSLACAGWFLSPSSFAQREANSYAEQTQREIKALSPEQIRGYLSGQGIGLALAAELNSYPGPRHAMELSAQLSLTEEQTAATRQSFERMQREAIRLGQLIVEQERRLDAIFAAGDAEAARVRAATGEIARLQGELRFAHLQAHLEMRRILRPEQIRRYDHLRGYRTPGGEQHQHQRRHGNH